MVDDDVTIDRGCEVDVDEVAPADPPYPAADVEEGDAWDDELAPLADDGKCRLP
jgi:hypothetical protein